MTTTLTPEQLALAQRILTGEDAGAPAVLASIQRVDTVGDAVIPDVHALIAAASESMGVKPVEKPGQVEAADANAISALVAIAAEHEVQAKFHTAQREAIKDALKAMVVAAEEQVPGEHIEALTVHGAPVFKYKRIEARALNQKAIKQLFPDIPENAELYTTTVTRRATFE